MSTIYKIKDRLRHAMTLRGMTGKELARKTGLQNSSITRYLSGANIPRSIAIEKMARALDVSPAWLLGYDLTIDGKPLVNIELDKLNEGNKARLFAYYQALLDSQEGDSNGNT